MKAYEGKHIDIVIEDGKEVVVHGPAVAIVAIDNDDTVTFVRQQRPGAHGKLLEIPAGNVDDGEEPLATAQRELREETGLRGGEWVEVARVYSSPGFCDERVHLFLARGVTHGEASPEGSEDIELVRIPVSEIETLIAEVEDAKTLAALLLYLRLR